MYAKPLSDPDRARIAAALQTDPAAALDSSEVEALLACELKKAEADMDTALIDACCAALCEMHGRAVSDAPEPLPPALRTRMRRTPSLHATLHRKSVRFTLRAAAAAACVTLVLFGADVLVSRRALRITQSGDTQQALVDFPQSAGKTVTHADANAANPFERVYLAPSLDTLWQRAGYTLPLPEALPAGMQAVRAYLLPMGSVDMITVSYADGLGARVCVQYWYDKTRESVLLGYESWPDREDALLPSGNTVLRFPKTDAESGLLNAAFIAPHLTCAIEAETISEADFSALLASFGVMEASAPPDAAQTAPDSPLSSQEPVTEYATPQLRFYSLADMTECVRMDVPLPERIPEGLAFSQGTYMHDDDWDVVNLRYEGADGRRLIYNYEIYGPAVAGGMCMGVEQNEEGRYVALPNGREAYIAWNMDTPFGLITGERSMISVHLTGGDEQALLDVLSAIPALPADF